MYFYSLPTGLKRLVVVTVITFVWILSVQLFQFTFATEGTASWYGPNFAGKLTANGEIYNPRELTAAHQSLAFNTIVRVTNLRNGQSVDVRINDRGPFIDNRIIDLSEAAAEYIDMKYVGTGPVRLNIIRAGDAPPNIQPVDSTMYSSNNTPDSGIKPVNSSVYNSTSTSNSSLSSNAYVPYTTYPLNSVNTVTTPLPQPIHSQNPFQNPLANSVSNAFNTVAAPTIVSRPYNAYNPSTQPLPFVPEDPGVNTATTYTVTKYSATQNPITPTTSSNPPSPILGKQVGTVGTMAGLTLQEVIVPNYPIGTQLLLGSVSGNQIWVQVISTQLPPKVNDTFLVSQDLLNLLGKDFNLLEQQ